MNFQYNTYSSLSQLLFRSKHHATAARAALALRCLDGRGVRVVIGTIRRDFILAIISNILLLRKN